MQLYSFGWTSRVWHGMARGAMAIGAMFLFAGTSMAQRADIDLDENPREQQVIFWRHPNNYLKNQADVAFETIDEVLQANPPLSKVQSEVLARRLALVSLDQILHDTRIDKSSPFYAFINRRMERMLQDMDRPVKKGMKIYKLYNDGFIIKTKKATIAVDLVPGGPKDSPFISDSIFYQIAGRCDAMFISHRHGDHANIKVAKAFAARGKRVIAPKGLWVGVDPLIEQLLVADTMVTVPFDELGMQLHILPGHQDDIPNNMYIMDFGKDGSVAHTGDQWNEEDVNWIDHIHEQYKIDALLLNCWVNQMERTIRGFGPKVLITGHENELEHTIDHREAYWMTMRKMDQMPTLKVPYVLMTWGEWYEIR